MFGKDWNILLGIGADKLPVSIRDICNYLKIKTMSYRNAEVFIEENNLAEYIINDAFSFKQNSSFTLLYNETLPENELRVAILHEVAHIVTGHCDTENDSFDGKCTTYNKVAGKDYDEVEEAAYKFALKLLSPACVLWALKIRSYKEIEELCLIPRRFARQRADRMDYLLKKEKHLLAKEGRTCFLRSPLERALYENFKPYIEKIKSKK